jgi:predicted kinase
VGRGSSISDAYGIYEANRRARLEEAHRRDDVGIEMLIGFIGSGKSTYARKWAEQGAVIICRDDMITMVHGCYRYESRWSLMYNRMMEESIKVAFDHGRNYVILDGTHLTVESRKRWIEYGIQHRYPIVATVFPMESPEVHARRRFESDPRGRSLEEWINVAEKHAEQWRWEPVKVDEGFKWVKPCEMQFAVD